MQLLPVEATAIEHAMPSTAQSTLAAADLARIRDRWTEEMNDATYTFHVDITDPITPLAEQLRLYKEVAEQLRAMARDTLAPIGI
jgi:hypothetical protein